MQAVIIAPPQYPLHTATPRNVLLTMTESLRSVSLLTASSLNSVKIRGLETLTGEQGKSWLWRVCGWQGE